MEGDPAGEYSSEIYFHAGATSTSPLGAVSFRLGAPVNGLQIINRDDHSTMAYIPNGAPTGAADLTRKDYVDAQIDSHVANYLPLAGGTVTGQIKGITPVDAADLVRKDYVDAQVASGGMLSAVTATGGWTWQSGIYEEWGIIAVGGVANPQQQVIFTNPFPNTTYMTQCTMKQDPNTEQALGYDSKYTSSFFIAGSWDDSGDRDVSWHVKGFMAVAPTP